MIRRPGGRLAVTEAPLDPGQPIVDAHHHLYERPGVRYLAQDYAADLAACGHDIRATIFVQARAMYRTDGPENMRPVGETEFAAGIGRGATGPARICAGIVGFADLTLGEAVRPVLEGHVAMADGATRQGGRFAGVRHVLAWDEDASLLNPAYPTSAELMETDAFRRGFAQLAPLGLTFDAWLHFHQIPRLVALARAFPDTGIVLDHCGGILGIAGYAGRRDKVFAEWALGIRDLATCPNVMVKLGGLGMPLTGFGFEKDEARPGSMQLAATWRAWMGTVIEAFGPARCMFESNFPPDKVSYDYGTGWNAMKRIAEGASADERHDLFWRTAARFYGLGHERS